MWMQSFNSSRSALQRFLSLSADEDPKLPMKTAKKKIKSTVSVYEAGSKLLCWQGGFFLLFLLQM